MENVGSFTPLYYFFLNLSSLDTELLPCMSVGGIKCQTPLFIIAYTQHLQTYKPVQILVL